MQQNVKSWNSVSITQFELAKILYTSGFLANFNLTATAKLVLMALVQHYNANKPEMFPSQKFLANQLGISEKSVERAIFNLKDANFIYYVTQRVNKYRFTAYFFEQIKMSDDLRQNVGRDDRQNVGQTNNHEKINNKEIFYNFEEKCMDLQIPQNGTDVPHNSIVKQIFSKDSDRKTRKNNNLESTSQILKSFEMPTPQAITADESLNKQYEDLKKREDDAKKDLKELFNSGKHNLPKCDNGNIFTQAIPEKPQMPSLEEQMSESILYRSKDAALKWICALSPLFRTRGLAKMLIDYHKITEDELWSDDTPDYLREKICVNE